MEPHRRFGVVGFSLLLIIQSTNQDSLDDIRIKIDAIAQKSTQRCSGVPNSEKVLPRNAISDLPLPFDPQGPIPEFRASMYEAQKIAVNRAIFFSYILQQAEVDDEPDMGYYFYSTLATLSSSDEKIMGSKIVFGKDMMLNSWYGGQNKSLPNFGPYAFKRFNTSQMLFAIDLGSDPSFAYTDEIKHITPNPWYAAWLSDRTSVELPQPALLELKVLKDNSGMETINFFGPPVELPAIWTMPFFDCLFTDKWQLSVTAPIADLDRATRFLTKRQVPRQSPAANMVNMQGMPANAVAPQPLPTIPSYIAAISVEMDYKRIDINQCDGDQQFNTFAGTHKCKRETTVCEPLSGHGLRRGGYQCMCKAGFKYPPGRTTPFSGGEVESAAATDYTRPDAFQCIPIQGQDVLVSPTVLAQSAASANLNAIPASPGSQPRRAANLQEQADNLPEQFVPLLSERNTPKSFSTFPSVLTRPTPPMHSVPPQTNSPFRSNPNPSFSQPQPSPVPNAPNFVQAASGSQTQFQQVHPIPQKNHPVPQFMPLPINVSSRAGPPQLPSFTPARSQQFFAPQNFQVHDAMGSPQKLQDVGLNTQRDPRQEPRFSPQFFSPNVNQGRMNHDLPGRRSRRQAQSFQLGGLLDPDHAASGSGPLQNSAVIQQLIQKLSQENNLMFRARQMLDNLSPRNCSASRFAEKVDLGFSQEFSRKIAKQFATQGRSALRLSHFLSNYLQNGLHVDGKRRNKLTENTVLGEMAAMIIAEPAIGAVSIQFEDGVFPGRRFFAPTALYNKMLDELQFYHYPDNYTNFDWYRDIKMKTAAVRLTDFAVDIKMRVDAAGSRFADVPTQNFKAVTFDDMKAAHGPYYDCFYLDKFFWFEVPFFAKKQDGAVQFGGLISVGINPDQIDVNQCSSAEEPLFRATDRCDRQTTTCVQLAGRGFRAGGYKCVCKEGFEYPYIDALQYFDGLAVEIEYQNKLLDFPNNFVKLRCRRAGQNPAAAPETRPALPVSPLIQTQSNRPPSISPASPFTLTPVRTQQTPQPPNQKINEDVAPAGANPWVPSIPFTITQPTSSQTILTTTTTHVPQVPVFPPNPVIPSNSSPNVPHTFVPSTGFGPQTPIVSLVQQRPSVPNNFAPQNNFVPNFEAPLGTFGTPFQPLPGQRPTLSTNGDGSSLIPDQQPSDISSVNIPQEDTNRANIPNAFAGSFGPGFFPSDTVRPITLATTVTSTTTTTTAASTTTPTTTTTTTTSTTTTTTPVPTPSEGTTPSTELIESVSAATTTAILNIVEEDTTPLFPDLDGMSTSNRAVTRHGPTKYTVKVIKGTTNPAFEAEASNEIRTGSQRRPQRKNNEARRIAGVTGVLIWLTTFITLVFV